MSTKQCVNCPGAVDHTTAECPISPERAAPSLPAAGSAVEVLLPALRQYRHNCGGDELIPGYDYEETNRIVAALSAQQSAHVSVPRELLERLEHVTRQLAPHLQCHADLIALLNGGEA